MARRRRDPPFMVNNDFRADNTVDIALTWEPSKGSHALPRGAAAGEAGRLPTRDGDDEVTVQVKKEPSLVEVLAYKDTWHQGLDSFLTLGF